MKICIVDGSQSDDRMGAKVRSLLTSIFSERGDSVEYLLLRDLKIAPCAGDFFCWIKTPGICRNSDDNRLVAKTMIQSDCMIILTPVRFGGYSSLLKEGLDHLIQNVSPLFTKVHHETHHKKRYADYPSLYVYGWLDAPDPNAEQIFKHLVGRNSINFNAERACCTLLYTNQDDAEINQEIISSLDGIVAPLRPKALNPFSPANNSTSPAKTTKAVLLVGSPRKSKSTSLSLGRYLCSKLAQQSVQVDTFHIYSKERGAEAHMVLLATICEADLVILAFPLYVDTLPSPVLAFLEQLARYRKIHKGDKFPHFVALVNCGFPEASQNENALAVCAQFAQEAGFVWGGGIALGGGNGLGSKELEDWGRRTRHIRRALDLAAVALHNGQAIPKMAVEIAAKPLYPAFLFRFGAQFFWKKAAAAHGAQETMHARPYLEE